METGIYKSTDAGRTWSNVGLRATKHIGRICVHPSNPDIVYVAALGDVFGPTRSAASSARAMEEERGRRSSTAATALAQSIYR
jgi:photosystem II stability/assembly factor-like uncharacterized protein